MCRSPDGGAGAPGRSSSHNPRRLRLLRRIAWVVLAGGLVVVGGRGGAGHQVGHYPSYYPDEIRIEVIDPAAAAKGLSDETLHAYVGTSPSFSGPVPEHVKAVKSPLSFLVLSFNAASARYASADARCAAARRVLAKIGKKQSADFVFHPYPVTPYHADYLHHLDLIEAARGAVGDGASTAKSVHLGAKGKLAEVIVRTRSRAGGRDASLEAVPVEDVIAGGGSHANGWSGPPWAREGWFQAHRLLAPGLDAGERQAADRAYEQLVRGRARSFAEHTELERRLVIALTKPCRRVVVGYAVKEEYFHEKYPEGVENVAYDALSGLNSAVFIRTVKLKDYPWNGKLRLGVRDGGEAAWNPVAGFADPTGRLVWSAIGDPAMIPFPFNASWMPNRVQPEVTRVVGQSGGMKVPADAVRPQGSGSGALQRVGERTFASAKVTYDVIASPFEDGSEMAVADLLYPYVFVHRWGSNASIGSDAHEPRLAALAASVEERLVGLKHVRTDTTNHVIADGLSIEAKTPVLEVYLRDAPGDERQVAALAPPWSTVPWHLLVAMEEAVVRGYAAFSKEEAARRKVAWMDLVRDPALRAKLLDLIAGFERESYCPQPLKNFVTADEARARWRALRTFAEKTGHLLVTNGPYRLKEWTPQTVVLEAVRDMTYPLGFGTFDRFVNPPRAVIAAVTQAAGEITVRADAEMVLKAGRAYRLHKEPLLHQTARGAHGLLVVSRYLLIGPDGKVLKAEKMDWKQDGRFAINLPDGLTPGQYTVILGIFLDGNALEPSAKVLRIRLGSPGAPG
jgi:hypothetical protein